MHSACSKIGALAIACASVILASCGKSPSENAGTSNPGSGSSSGGGVTGTYASVENEALTFEFKSGGTVVMAAKDLGSSTGTYTVDGEKIIVSIDNQKHTFIRDGDCIEEPRQIFGKLCKGGRAGAAANVSTRNVPNPPTGIWVATNEDGEFKIEFKPGNKLTMTLTPPGGKPQPKEAKFEVEGDTIYVTLEDSTPVVLKYVNNAFESNAFGLPMKFVKQ
jgi:hypothetical protein